MSDTHPNAFRNEAAEKRAQGNALLSEADALDAQADTLEGVEPEVMPQAESEVEPEALGSPDAVEGFPEDTPKKVEVKEG